MNKNILLHTSLLKTLRFNISYFGWRGGGVENFSFQKCCVKKTKRFCYCSK